MDIFVLICFIFYVSFLFFVCVSTRPSNIENFIKSNNIIRIANLISVIGAFVIYLSLLFNSFLIGLFFISLLITDCYKLKFYSKLNNQDFDRLAWSEIPSDIIKFILIATLIF